MYVYLDAVYWHLGQLEKCDVMRIGNTFIDASFTNGFTEGRRSHKGFK